MLRHRDPFSSLDRSLLDDDDGDLDQLLATVSDPSLLANRATRSTPQSDWRALLGPSLNLDGDDDDPTAPFAWSGAAGPVDDAARVDLARLQYLGENPGLQVLHALDIDLDVLRDDALDNRTPSAAPARTNGTQASALLRTTTRRTPTTGTRRKKESSDMTLDDLDPLLAALKAGADDLDAFLAADLTAPRHPAPQSVSPPPVPLAPRSKLVQRDLRSFRARQLDRTLQARAAHRRQTTPIAPAPATTDAIHAHLAVSSTDPDLQQQVDLHRAVLDNDRRDRELADEAKRNEIIARQLDAKIKAEQRARLEREARKREMAVEAMVDEYVRAKAERKLVAAFNAWRHHAQRTRLACIKLEARRDWHRKRAAFTNWHARMVKEIADREARKVAQELRHKEELGRRADRHWRFHALSRYFLAWTAFAALVKQERELENAHQARKRKVDQFLAHLQEKRDAMARDATAPPPAHEIRTSTRDGNQSRSPAPSRSQTPSRSTPTPAARPPRLAPPPTRPAFLARMEERERERRVRKAEREARHADAVERARLEAEQAELDRVERERREAQQRADEERAAAEAAERARQHAREQWQRAIAHADRAKVKYRGFRPWRRWVETQKEAMERADRWHEGRVVRWVVHEWARAARARVKKRAEVATRHWERVQLVQAWRAWVKFAAVHRAQIEQAEDIAQHRLLAETLRNWRDRAQHQRQARLAKEEADDAKADAMAARVLPRRYFAHWRAVVQQAKDDRWKEYRRTMLRNKVRSWLQDSSFERMCQEAELSSPMWATSALAHTTSSTVAAAERDDDAGHG